MRRSCGGLCVALATAALSLTWTLPGAAAAEEQAEPAPVVEGAQAAASAAAALAQTPAAEPAWREREREYALHWGERARSSGRDSAQPLPWARLLSGFLFVLALTCAGIFALKRLSGRAPLNRGRYLEVLESRAVGRKMRLVLVRVAGRVVLIAGEGEHASAVTEFSQEELPAFDETPSPTPKGFAPLLRRLSGAKAPAQPHVGGET